MKLEPDPLFDDDVPMGADEWLRWTRNGCLWSLLALVLAFWIAPVLVTKILARPFTALSERGTLEGSRNPGLSDRERTPSRQGGDR